MADMGLNKTELAPLLTGLNTRLVAVSLEGNELGDDGSELLADVLRAPTKLLYLNLDGAGAVCAGVLETDRDRRLTGVKLRNAALTRLAQSLQHNRVLEVLSLESECNRSARVEFFGFARARAIDRAQATSSVSVALLHSPTC
jgi:hypothetical protein